MVAPNPKVDLFTFNRDLESLIFEKYPDFLFPEKHHIDDTDKDAGKLYCFYDLDLPVLQNFLKDKNFEYELRDSETGEIIKTSTPSQNL